MKVVGVEIKGSSVYMVDVTFDGGLVVSHAESCASFTVGDDEDSQCISSIFSDIRAYLSSVDADMLVIKQRSRKGRMIGSPTGFKLEALVQINAQCPVHIVKANDLKKFYGGRALPLEFSDAELFSYQEQAFVCANYGGLKLT